MGSINVVSLEPPVAGPSHRYSIHACKEALGKISKVPAVPCFNDVDRVDLGSLCVSRVETDTAVYSAGSVNEFVSGGTFNVTGDILTPSITSPGSLTFVGSGSEVTDGTSTSQGATDFSNLTTALGGLSYGSLALTTGVVNNISPGNYTISGGNVSLGAGTTINLLSSGVYVFNLTGSFVLAGVTINALDAGIDSDNVYWYASTSLGQVSITNSIFFGDIVTVSSANHQIVSTTGGAFTGRFLSSGAGQVALQAIGSTEDLVSSGTGASPVPEPATPGLIFGALAVMAWRRSAKRG